MTLRQCVLILLGVALMLASCSTPPANPTQTAAIVSAPGKRIESPLNGRKKVSSVSLTELFELQQSNRVLLFDARPWIFYSLGHLPGAISLPKANCDEQITKHQAEIKSAMAAHKSIVIYCTNMACPDARTVAMHFADCGYPCATLLGGWESWKESGLPTE
ncbi:MAG: rhodanese-like domain-containing protein [Akkermansiaceae bacterium]|nr:rhodanese-like domain-containing protein [Akkermansiaceae bacterium]